MLAVEIDGDGRVVRSARRETPGRLVDAVLVEDALTGAPSRTSPTGGPSPRSGWRRGRFVDASRRAGPVRAAPALARRPGARPAGGRGGGAGGRSDNDANCVGPGRGGVRLRARSRLVAVVNARHRHRRRRRARRPGAARPQRDGRRVRPHAGGPGRAAVPVRRAGLLGAVLQPATPWCAWPATRSAARCRPCSTSSCGGDPARLTGPMVSQAAEDGDLARPPGVRRPWATGWASGSPTWSPPSTRRRGRRRRRLGGRRPVARARPRRAGPVAGGRGHRPVPTGAGPVLGPEAGFIGAADLARSAARRSRSADRRRDRRARRRNERWFRVRSRVPEPTSRV